MSAEKPQEGALVEKKSLAQIAEAKRRASEENAVLAAKQAAETSAAELRDREAQEGSVLKQQIAELESKKKRLEDLREKIQEAYKGVDAAVGDFKEADRVIKQMMEASKDVLSEPLTLGEPTINTKKIKKSEAEGSGEEPHPDFRDELLGNEQTEEVKEGDEVVKKAEFKAHPEINPDYKETSGFRERQKTLRDKIKEVMDRKDEIKKELPEGTDISVGSTKKEGKDNEDVVVAKMQEEIARLQEEIKGLVERTPEKIAERKKISDCKENLISRKLYCTVPINGYEGISDPDRIRKVSLFIEQSRVTDYVNEYGEDAFKEAIFDLILPNFIKLMTGKNSDEVQENNKAALEKMLKAKIDRDVAEQVLYKEQKDGDLHYATGRKESLSKESGEGERFLAELASFRQLPSYAELKDKFVKIADGRNFGPSRFGQGELKVFDVNGEDKPMKEAKGRLEEAKLKLVEFREKKDELKKPLLNFGEKGRRYEQQMNELKRELTRYEGMEKEAQKNLNDWTEAYQRNPSVVIREVVAIIEKSGIKTENLQAYSQARKVEDIVDQLEKLVRQKAENKPAQNLVIKANRYAELKDEFDRAEMKYRSSIV